MYTPEKPFSKKILDIIAKTWDNKIQVINGYAMQKTPEGYYLTHTDGVGTKALLHWNKKSFDAAAIDAFAMNINDLAILGFAPRTLTCHLLLEKECEDAIFSVVGTLSDLCKEYHVSYLGGETAILNTLHGMEVGVHMDGFAPYLIHEPLIEGDLVFGYLSSGIHSNGLTLARSVLGNAPPDLTIPTRIYYQQLEQTREYAKKRMHITGGAFTKLKMLEAGFELDLRNVPLHQLFYDLYEHIQDTHVMYKTFNCGIGFVEVVSKKNEEAYRSVSNARCIGRVVRGSGIHIRSPFNESWVLY